MLAPGKRTVTSCLRILGRSQERHFVNYHRVLSRARWNGREASRLLLGLLVARLVPTGPMVLGIDDTVERRRGKRIRAKGIYRDPVRSSHSHFVKASGLRWVSLMLLAPVLLNATIFANERHLLHIEETTKIRGTLGDQLQWQRRLGAELRIPTTERLFQVSIQHPCPHL
jgi:DDE superfamily endonuclease